MVGSKIKKYGARSYGGNILMFFKVTGKLSKFAKYIVYKNYSSQIVCPSRFREDGLAGFSFATSPFNNRFYTTTARRLASERKSADF